MTTQRKRGDADVIRIESLLCKGIHFGQESTSLETMSVARKDSMILIPHKNELLLELNTKKRSTIYPHQWLKYPYYIIMGKIVILNGILDYT